MAATGVETAVFPSQYQGALHVVYQKNARLSTLIMIRFRHEGVSDSPFYSVDRKSGEKITRCSTKKTKFFYTEQSEKQFLDTYRISKALGRGQTVARNYSSVSQQKRCCPDLR